MSQPNFAVGLVALLLAACSGSSDPLVEPRADGGTEDDDLSTTVPTGFFSIPETLDESGHHAAELTREACFADYSRLASLLGTLSATEHFHPVEGGQVDVEWIEPDAPAIRTDGPVDTRQGAGAVFDGHRDASGNAYCVVTPYESYGFLDAPDGADRMTATRIDASLLACASDSIRPDVTSESLPLFVVDDGDGVHTYGSIGRRYTVTIDGVSFRTDSVRGVSRRTLDAERAVTYVVECTAPARLPDGGSILVAPSTTPVTPAEPFTGSGAFVGRPWQLSARLAQDAVDAHGVLALRQTVERGVLALGPVGDDADVACPLGGSAVMSRRIEAYQETHRYAFAGCVLEDGTRLEGFHDSDLRRQDEGDSVRRSREERFALRVDAISANGRAPLEASGTLSDALTGKRADACGLLVQERVLRIDVPLMQVGTALITALAIEDITNVRIKPAMDGNCGTQVHEYAFSDSARIEQALPAGDIRRFTVNRTGSVLLDETGVVSSSGRDAMIRIYDGDNDDSLDIAPDFSRTDGAIITIDEHPGQVRFPDSWRFVER